MTESFRVGITRDFLKDDGTLAGDLGLDLLDAADGIEYEFLPKHSRVLSAEEIADYDALLLLQPQVTAETASASRLKLIARSGVGYDSIDVDACTKNGVVITITPDGVRRPVAVAAMMMLMALSHKLVIKDRLTRAGRWSEKVDHMGQGLTGRTLGLIGLGNIGKEILKMAAPFDMQHQACDPFVQPESLADIDVNLVDLETVLRTSDYVIICCKLDEGTHHLINRERLQMMKPTGYLINMARGPVVDQPALTEALRDGVIEGAALDVFEQEPVDPNDPILTLDNVIVTPHGICWTDESFSGNGRSACKSIINVAAGRVPENIINPAVLDQPQLRAKLPN